ncbi:hypothetical protein Busp01_12540 [Trinickia caryophylli]|uniref:Glycosyltransferase involved in cell wall bisynthesis n=2 Tax=Trinickia caryophylli TaxID=28094 RepID=A0A1X7DDC0_TRICW|nr:hypothetical protein Busp01_12540 [Trinickia caryophylli]SMF13330.1 Glycosyltransferase involved in cell wall bisynthesis [Trinickia caryophylli]
MSPDTLLTICIPSYNRGPRVYSLVLFLAGILGDRLGTDVEILVANNCSTDDTEALLAPLCRPGLRVHTHAAHYPSAEENIFNSLELCTGRYVWFHGDDDIPTAEGIELLMDNIRSDAADIFCFNSAMINSWGEAVNSGILPINRPYLDVDAAASAQVLGFTFYMAGITNLVFRRDIVDKETAYRAYRLQPIYSHVAWVYVSFRGKRMRIVNYPLVHYRMSVHETVDHFRNYAKKHNISDHMIWGFGMVRLLAFMVDEGALTPAEVGRIVDLRPDGSRVSLVVATMQRMYEQLMASVARAEERSKVPYEEFVRARDFLYRVDPMSFDLLRVLEELYRIGEHPKSRARIAEIRESFCRMLHAQDREVLYRLFFAGQAYGYHIYRCLTGYVAISPQRLREREEILRWADPLESVPYAFCDADRNVLIARIEAYVKARGNAAESDPTDRNPEAAHLLHSISSTLHGINHTTHSAVEIYRQSSAASRVLWKVFARIVRKLRRLG